MGRVVHGEKTSHSRRGNDVVDDEAENVRQQERAGEIHVVAFALVPIEVETVGDRNGNPRRSTDARSGALNSSTRLR